MFNSEALLEIMQERRGENIPMLAAYLGMTRQSLYQTFKGGHDLKLSLLQKIAERYYLSPEEVHDIFIFPEQPPKPEKGFLVMRCPHCHRNVTVKEFGRRSEKDLSKSCLVDYFYDDCPRCGREFVVNQY